MVGGMMGATPHYEQGLIGSLFVRPELLSAVAEVLPSPEMFMLFGTRRIYAAMLEIARGGKLPCIEAVLGYFVERGKLDEELRVTIRLLGDSVPVGDNAVPFARDVRAAYRDREARMREIEIVRLRGRGAGINEIAAAVKDLHAWLDESQTDAAGRSYASSAEAIAGYLERLRRGQERLLPLGIADLDRALAGGVGFGEFVAFAAPSNHCKSSLALHVVHHASACGLPCLVVSAEMSAELLGKRTLQTLLDGMSEHDYADNLSALESAAEAYQENHAPWYVDDRSTKLDDVLASIDGAVKRYGVRLVAIDYLQMIECRAANKFEGVSYVSSALCKKAKEHGIVILALCQMNNQIVRRPKFQPKVGDIEYGPQIFKDADVVIFGVWPHRVDETQPPSNYDFYLAKSRNRPLLRSVLQARWDPARQVFYCLTNR